MKSEDYIIVENKKNILIRFNHLVIETLEDLRKKKHHKALENCEQLKKLYNKLVIDNKRKIILGILLKEIYNKIEFTILKQNIKKDIKKHKLIKKGKTRKARKLLK